MAFVPTSFLQHGFSGITGHDTSFLNLTNSARAHTRIRERGFGGQALGARIRGVVPGVSRGTVLGL